MLTIWCNAKFSGQALARLQEATSPYNLIFSGQIQASNLTVGGPDPELAMAHIAFGQPDPDSVIQSERLRWVQLTTAGYARYDTEEFRAAAELSGLAVTNSSSVYAEPCAEHALAFMLSSARRLPQSLDNQRTDQGWPALALRAQCRLLKNQSVLFLGFGAIGKRLAELLAPFECTLSALRRTPLGNEAAQLIDPEALPEALAAADHVVNLLPDNAGTKNFVNAQTFAAMKDGAVFYNIGRGTTVDQDALLAALRGGKLAGAYLDVTDPEPLPKDHALWQQSNCFITPHTGGGHDTEEEALVEHFLDNLGEYISGSGVFNDRII